MTFKSLLAEARDFLDIHSINLEDLKNDPAKRENFEKDFGTSLIGRFILLLADAVDWGREPNPHGMRNWRELMDEKKRNDDPRSK